MLTPDDHPFPDRRAAGVELAARLERLRPEAPVILALEPGGVPVGEVVAEEFGAPFGVIAVARMGKPGHRFGAVAEDGPPLVEHDLARALGIGPEALAIARAEAEAAVAERARPAQHAAARAGGPHGGAGRRRDRDRTCRGHRRPGGSPARRGSCRGGRARRDRPGDRAASATRWTRSSACAARRSPATCRTGTTSRSQPWSRTWPPRNAAIRSARRAAQHLVNEQRGANRFPERCPGRR